MTDTTPKQSVGTGCLGMVACMAVFPILHLQAILRPDAQPRWIGIDPKSGEQVRAGYIFFAIFWISVWVLVLLFNPNDDAPKAPDGVPAIDQRAYDELKRQGSSDGEARNSAAAVRRFCEAGGGRDCS